jgi:hypothetical protein
MIKAEILQHQRKKKITTQAHKLFHTSSQPQGTVGFLCYVTEIGISASQSSVNCTVNLTSVPWMRFDVMEFTSWVGEAWSLSLFQKIECISSKNTRKKTKASSPTQYTEVHIFRMIVRLTNDIHIHLFSHKNVSTIITLPNITKHKAKNIFPCTSYGIQHIESLFKVNTVQAP